MVGHIPAWAGATVCDRDGAPVGTVRDVLFCETTHRPVWLQVDLGPRIVHVPFAGARCRRQVRVPYAADAIRTAPDAPGHVLWRHYGLRPHLGTCRAAIEQPRVLAA